MATLETLTLTDLKQTIKSGSLNKGYKYLHRIQNAARAGQTLTAEVIGSRRYDVEIEATPAGLVARCTCPYDWGGYCKHIATVLLKWVESPRTFTVKEAGAAETPAAPLTVSPVESLPAQQPKAPPFWLTESAEDRRQRDLKKLYLALEQLKVQELRDLAKKRNWTVKGTSKADLARQIGEYIVQPEEIEKARRSLDEEHRQVLRALVVLGHDENLQLADIERVAKVWGNLKSYKKLATYTSHLSEAGLALPASAMGLYSLDAGVVPRALASKLPPLLAEVISSHANRPPDSTATELRLADPSGLVRQANQVALLLEQTAPPLRTPIPRPRLEKFYPALAEWDYDPAEILKLSQRSNLQPYAQDVVLTVPAPAWSLPDETVARLAPIAGDEARLEFIFALLVAAGLFYPGSPVTVWPEIKEQYHRQTEVAQRAILARAYFLMLNWSELWDLLRANSALQLRRAWNHPYFKPPTLAANLTRFRQLILRTLACLPDGEWVALENLHSLFRAVWPSFDGHSTQPYYGYGALSPWSLTYHGRDLKSGDKEGWHAAQGAFIRRLISGPLHWLGLADLSLKNGVLIAARFHGLADLYWDREETPVSPHTVITPATPPAEAVKMDESSITVDPAAISAQAHSLLDQIARLDQALPGRFVYRLDAQAAHQAFEKGVTLADILHDWEQSLALPLPQTLRSQLESWWRAYGQVRIYDDVTVIEFGDDYALTEMKAVTSLGQHLIAELSPRLVLIPKAAVGSLTAELEKAGYTPKQTDDVQ
ncbi:MAG: hypothetical protein BroJett011_65350 [Chloroflexota bacterium]|nr:MAG: hypothetical protein BroJett011_65350 [Chloroflexota bacterium]